MMTNENIFARCTCPKERWAPVYSNGGQVLAQQCRDCLNIVRISGKCVNCSRESENIITVAQRQYCSKDCVNAERAKEKVKKEERAKHAKEAAKQALRKTA